MRVNSISKMEQPPGGAYNWIKRESIKELILRENVNDAPPESVLLMIWQHQRLNRDALVTVDGRRIRVLHPGFVNSGEGPDFTNAVIQFDGENVRRGDVEVDVLSSNWIAHGHFSDSRYRNVVLQVVWDVDHTHIGWPPILPIRGCTDSPVIELMWWYGRCDPRVAILPVKGRCAEIFSKLCEGRLRKFVEGAAEHRLASKVARFTARAALVGWTQSLWEGLFRSLGFKHNTWPMFCLGELRPILPSPEAGLETIQSILFGLSGLLPHELPRKSREIEEYVRRMWHIWWRCQTQYHRYLIPSEIWRFKGVRPANHPHRRLALVSHWLAEPSFIMQLEHWATNPGTKPWSSLQEILVPKVNGFWETHYSLFSSAARIHSQLLGKHRVTDLAVNVIIPWLRAKALATGDHKLADAAMKLYFDWPAGQDNSILKVARERFFGLRECKFSWEKTAAFQQGLIQLVHDFCCNRDPICTRCRLVEMLSRL